MEEEEILYGGQTERRAMFSQTRWLRTLRSIGYDIVIPVNLGVKLIFLRCVSSPRVLSTICSILVSFEHQVNVKLMCNHCS